MPTIQGDIKNAAYALIGCTQCGRTIYRKVAEGAGICDDCKRNTSPPAAPEPEVPMEYAHDPIAEKAAAKPRRKKAADG